MLGSYDFHMMLNSHCFSLTFHIRNDLLLRYNGELWYCYVMQITLTMPYALHGLQSICHLVPVMCFTFAIYIVSHLEHSQQWVRHSRAYSVTHTFNVVKLMNTLFCGSAKPQYQVASAWFATQLFSFLRGYVFIAWSWLIQGEWTEVG